MGWIPRGPVLHPGTGMVGHVRGTRMVRARGRSPARNFRGRVGDEVGIEKAVGLLLLRRRRRRVLTTSEGVRVFHFAAGHST